ncbi:WhiB family transcriptional regulator [Mycobacterium stomatepiae]|nr:WhiB family transcriptional regulator [Mycobacterium stomatepiae]
MCHNRSQVFFPHDKSPDRDAKSVCLSCRVREQCLEYAMEHDERFGA